MRALSRNEARFRTVAGIPEEFDEIRFLSVSVSASPRCYASQKNDRVRQVTHAGHFFYLFGEIINGARQRCTRFLRQPALGFGEADGQDTDPVGAFNRY